MSMQSMPGLVELFCSTAPCFAGDRTGEVLPAAAAPHAAALLASAGDMLAWDCWCTASSMKLAHVAFAVWPSSRLTTPEEPAATK